MADELVNIQTAVTDFNRARRKAALQEIFARIRGKSVNLLSYEEIRKKLKASAMRDRGLHDIPMDAIVGSVGRYTDFTRSFLPKDEVDPHRWARVKVAALDMVGLPPIEVYKIGDVYFVRDGNHRVSVAREIGASHIQAYVTEIQTEAPMTPDLSPDELILRAEYAAFLSWSDFHRLLPDVELLLTAPGKYDDLKEHISVHRYYMGVERDRPVSLDEAVAHWYETVYKPVVETIERLGVMRDFPDRTETDLYLWIAEHRAALEESLGWSIEQADVVEDLVDSFSPKPDRVLARMGERLASALTPESLSLVMPAPGQWRRRRMARYGRDPDHLFNNILVAIDGRDTGWMALEQALEMAQREKGQIFGLHLVSDETEAESDAAQALRETFERQCAEADVHGDLAISAGTVAHEVSLRARWADLLVASLKFPPGAGPLEKLRSGFRTMIVNSPCPVLALPKPLFPISHTILAYDGSPKSREALYVATYMSHCCTGMELAIVSCSTDTRQALDNLEEAEDYLKDHEIGAESLAIERDDVGSVIREIADTHDTDLIIMGGYGYTPVVEIMLGSTVNEVLRTARRPTLICR